MSREVLKDQFLRMKKALLSLDHGAAGGAVWYRTNSAAAATKGPGIQDGQLVRRRRLRNSTMPNGLINDF